MTQHRVTLPQPSSPAGSEDGSAGQSQGVQRVGYIHCSFFRVRDAGDAQTFAGQEALVGRWVAEQSGAPGNTLLTDELKRRLCEGEASEEVREVLVRQRRLGTRPGYIDVVVYHWHDTAAWLVEVSHQVGGQPALGAAFALEALEKLAPSPHFGTSEDQFIGQTIFTRVVTSAPWTAEQQVRLAVAWFGGVTHDRVTESTLLHTTVLEGAADLYALPVDTTRRQQEAAWRILQIVSAENDAALDDLTANQLRQIESYAHKSEHLAADYPRLQHRMFQDRVELESTARDSVEAWLRASPSQSTVAIDHLPSVQQQLDTVTDHYLALSYVATRVREARSTVRLNLQNLDNRRVQLGTPGPEEDGIYAYRSKVGHRLVRQMDGDLDYAEATLHEAETILGTMGTRLEIRRQESVDTEQRELLDELRKESIILKVLTYGLLALTGVLAWGVYLAGKDPHVEYEGLSKSWALMGGLIAAIVTVVLTWLLTWWFERQAEDSESEDQVTDAPGDRERQRQ